MLVNCAHCGVELKRPPSRVKAHPHQFCDMACLGAYRQNQTEVQCDICGKPFSVKVSRSHQNNAITCSPACLGELRRRNIIRYHHSEDARLTACDFCGAPIARKPSQIDKYTASYCNSACKSAGQSGPHPDLCTGMWVQCETCGTDCWRTAATLQPHTFCSRKCAGRAGQSRPNHPGCRVHGADHWRWSGGHRPYTPGFNLKLSRRIRERDGHRCRLCDAPWEPRAANLVVHHVDLLKNNHDEDNLITLCRSCHMQVHNREEVLALG